MDKFTEAYLQYLATNPNISYQAYVLRALSLQNMPNAGLLLDRNEFANTLQRCHQDLRLAACLSTPHLYLAMTLMPNRVERGFIGVGPFVPNTAGNRLRLTDYSIVPRILDELGNGDFSLITEVASNTQD